MTFNGKEIKWESKQKYRYHLTYIYMIKKTVTLYSTTFNNIISIKYLLNKCHKYWLWYI